jgi:hypothetical protein
MSIFNPADAAMMKQEGSLNPDMSVRQFLETQGIDVEGPVTQLLKFAKDQIDKAKPVNKMAAIAGQAAAPLPQGIPQGAPQGQAMGGPGLGGLLSNLKR